MNNPKVLTAESAPSRSPLPAALQIAEQVDDCQIEGEYDTATDTWSDREYVSAGSKKHNEAM
jgi:hypothetical protein